MSHYEEIQAIELMLFVSFYGFDDLQKLATNELDERNVLKTLIINNRCMPFSYSCETYSNKYHTHTYFHSLIPSIRASVPFTNHDSSLLFEIIYLSVSETARYKVLIVHFVTEPALVNVGTLTLGIKNPASKINLALPVHCLLLPIYRERCSGFI